MNGSTSNTHASTRPAKPPPTGPAPSAAPPAPPTNAHPPPANRGAPAAHAHAPNHAPAVNGSHPPPPAKAKKKNEPAPVDPATMYESVKNRIAALEEEEVLEEEEEKRFAEEAQKSVKGMEDNVIHSKYIELFAELKRVERDHAKEKQKLTKDKDAAKGQLTKANQTKTKMENLARELQKDNKRLREDSKRLAQSVDEAQEEILRLKNDMAKREDKAKLQDVKFRETPDIVVKVVCRYRAELFFKISRKTKLSRLFLAWTDRMENIGAKGAKDAAEDTVGCGPGMQFMFTHNGRPMDAEQTPEEAGVEDGDEVLAVELVDLTEATGPEDYKGLTQARRQKLKKYWVADPDEAQRTLEDIFDGVVRERLKEVLRQYELRERHFECVIRSKELEVLLSRARAAEQKQLAESERTRFEKSEEENQNLRKELETAQSGQTMLIDKLITCCKEPNAERTQRLFASLREELEKRGTKFPELPAAAG